VPPKETRGKSRVGHEKQLRQTWEGEHQAAGRSKGEKNLGHDLEKTDVNWNRRGPEEARSKKGKAQG